MKAYILWSKISKNWNPPRWVPLHRFFKNWLLLFINTALQSLHSDSFYLVKKFPPWGISILGDFRPTGYNLSGCGSIWSKSILGRCVLLKIRRTFCALSGMFHLWNSALSDCCSISFSASPRYHLSCFLKNRKRITCLTYTVHPYALSM